jgi:hypothetical protein
MEGPGRQKRVQEIQRTFSRQTSAMGLFDGPPGLEDAVKAYRSDDTIPTCGILRLLHDGERRKQHNDYTRGS